MNEGFSLHRVLFLLWIACVLSACTTTGTYNRGPAPPTVESSPSTEHSQDKPRPEEPGSISNEPQTHSSSLAIQALLIQSRQSRASGNLPQAIGHVERALRIEPKRADLWLELAGLHLEALNFQNAEQVARKSLSFAQESVAQARSAWYIIATALEASGDKVQAAQIRRYVKTL